MRVTMPDQDDARAEPVAASCDEAAAPTVAVGKAEFEALATFRYALRRFQRFSESAARAEGLTPQQHELLLAIRGFPGAARPSVSDLAQRLQLCTQSMVGLLDRAEALGLLRRIPDNADRRRVFISLTPAGEAKLHRLATQHRAELRSIGSALYGTAAS